jgi:acyl-CoA thioesterase
MLARIGGMVRTMTKDRMTPEDRATKSAEMLMRNDAATAGIGASLDAVGPGWARMSMQVRADMLNGHGICHGGYIFMLADSAFAFACNSFNEVAVAQSNQITYLAPGKPDEVLVAEARASGQAGRSAVYDVTVTGEGGRTIALFRGLSRTLQGTHFEE